MNPEVSDHNLEKAYKTADDRIKIIAEAKCTLDCFLNSPNLSEEGKSTIVIPIIQTAGSKYEISCYRLVADGLYALDSIGSLAVTPVLTDFTESSHTWFTLLIRLKNMVLKLYDNCALLEQRNTNDTSTATPRESSFSSFTRGTFFPPTEASSIPRIPPNLYSPYCLPLNGAPVKNGFN